MTPSSSPCQLTPACHFPDSNQTSGNNKSHLKDVSESTIEEINTIKVDILDIRTKLNSLLSPTVSRTPDPATETAPPDLPSSPDASNLTGVAATQDLPATEVTPESMERISVVAEVYAGNDSDVTNVSIEEDISDVEVVEPTTTTISKKQLN